MSRSMLYEGKAKILYEGPEAGTIIQYFKDDATAYNAQKKDSISQKGVLNNLISAHLLPALGAIGVPHHFIEKLNLREQLVKQVEIVPIEVIVRNVAAGSICKRLGLEEGEALPYPLIEFCIKDDALGDPVVAREHITLLGLADDDELDEIVHLTEKVNHFLTGLFFAIGVRLIDFKLEFGRLADEDGYQIILADEISPDNCRLWDAKTNEKMDKDRFRRDLGGLVEAYSEIAKRLGLKITFETENQ